MIRVLAVENYRSLRDLVLQLGRLTVVSGANGTGKSSLYRALRLLADGARNGAVAALAGEGGLASTLWAGDDAAPGRNAPVALRLGFAGDEIGYAVDFGLPSATTFSLFRLDPEIRREAVWHGPMLRRGTLLAERVERNLKLRTGDGWTTLTGAIGPFDSMLGQFADPERAPELMAVREQVRGWRFYDQVRTDAGAPARRPHVATRTPVLAADGSDLAAALQTIRENGDERALDAAVDAAFPGSVLDVEAVGGRLEVSLAQPGMRRPLGAAELSDGTLRYLLWAAALLTPRPPALMVLNEPETSLHPDLLAPLARMIGDAASRTQVVVVTHALPLAEALDETAGRPGGDVVRLELVKQGGATALAGRDRFDRPAWQWPKR